MKAILLGTSGFWQERDVEALPPYYKVPWIYPPDFEAQSSKFYPSYGLMEFECIARGGGNLEIAVYLQTEAKK